MLRSSWDSHSWESKSGSWEHANWDSKRPHSWEQSRPSWDSKRSHSKGHGRTGYWEQKDHDKHSSWEHNAGSASWEHDIGAASWEHSAGSPSWEQSQGSASLELNDEKESKEKYSSELVDQLKLEEKTDSGKIQCVPHTIQRWHIKGTISVISSDLTATNVMPDLQRYP